LFIDESGDAATSLVLTAVELPTPTVVRARETTAELVQGMRSLLPGLDRERELHARRLARPLTPSEVAALAGEPPFRTHERQFVYQHALHHLSELPGVQVYTVMWRWKGSFSPKGRSGGRRYKDLLAELLEWVGDDPTPIGEVTIDQGGQEPWYRKALDAAQEARGEQWAVTMARSEDDQLVQLADLGAFAAYQSATPGRPGSHPFMVDWWRVALESVFAPGGDGYGLRHFDGEVEPVPR
jgi:hypothetical protein